MTVTVSVQRFPHGETLSLPAYATPESAGMDLLAAVEHDTVLAPLQRILVPTGIAMALPPGFEAQIRPRSGLALKSGITVLNSPGTIDADYRGEIKVLLINLSDKSFVIERGARIAQMVIAPVSRAFLEEAASLDETARASGGFGSTGTK